MKRFISNQVLFFLTLVCVIFSGCTDTSGIEDDIKKLTARIDNLESAVQSLQTALSNGKLISSIIPEEEGWALTFSDNSVIHIIGKEGVRNAVPRVTVSDEGNWMVSYDGESYMHLLDNSGNRIQAIGKDGETPETISVRIVTDENGYYVFELYSSKDPDTAVEVITTSLPTNPNALISSIVRNDYEEIITLTMADGSVFNFKIDPSLSANHTCEISSFRLLANDNKDYLLRDVTAQIQGRNINILIPYVCDAGNLKPTVSLVNTQAKIVEDLDNGLDLTKQQSITVIDNNGKSLTYLINTKVFTGLPIMKIETDSRYISPDKEVYVNGTIEISKTNEFPEGFSAATQLKGRGNATWKDYPKKPYRIKLDKKASIFNIPSDKSWVLLAGYCDKSLLRASIQFKLSEILDLEWTPKWQYVELFLNGQYQGNYLFTEHIKTSQSRVNVEDDGYLIERDSYASQEPVYFKSNIGWEYSFKTPDPDEGISQTQIDYAKSYINRFEEALLAPDRFNDDAKIFDIIDVDSWVKWFLVNFILANQDTNDYYVISSKNAKLKKGPVWDAEWSIGIGWDDKKPVSSSIECIGAYPYYAYLLQNKRFRTEVYTTFINNKDIIKTLLIDYVNDMSDYLYLSQQQNFEKWPMMNSVVGVNYTANGTWENELQYIKTFLCNRIEWMEDYLNPENM